MRFEAELYFFKYNRDIEDFDRRALHKVPGDTNVLYMSPRAVDDGGNSVEIKQVGALPPEFIMFNALGD